MAINVAQMLAQLERMTVTELRRKYAEVHGEETRCGNKQYLVRRIAWRAQALEEGGLSERARARAMELANDADLRRMSPRRQTDDIHVPLEDGRNTVTGALHVSQDVRLPMPAHCSHDNTRAARSVYVS